MNRRFLAPLIVSCVVLVLTGCINTKLHTNSKGDTKPVIMQTCIGSYWGYWITKSPQQLLDEIAQSAPGEVVSTKGIYRIEVEQNAVDDLIAILSVGCIVPVSVSCWLEDDAHYNTLPIEVKHSRHGLKR